MNRDEIIRMAREAGFPLMWDQFGTGILKWSEVEHFAALVASAEREECALECESYKVGVLSYFEIDEYLQDAANAIRARGEK